MLLTFSEIVIFKRRKLQGLPYSEDQQKLKLVTYRRLSNYSSSAKFIFTPFLSYFILTFNSF